MQNIRRMPKASKDDNVVTWNKPNTNSMYIERLAINPMLSRRVVGSQAIELVKGLATKKNLQSLRIYLVLTNDHVKQ